jgi:hypothetical protein
MSRTSSLFILVEGRVNDRPFYERLLAQMPSLTDHGFSVRVVEDLSLGGKSSGGKPFALTLHDYFLSSNELSQSNSTGVRQIAFMLDRDYSDFEGEPVRGPHVILTKSADVETEILSVGKLRRSIESTYGLTRSQMRKVISKGTDPLDSLARHWESWITFRAISCACGVHNQARYGAISQVNENGFGPLDPAANASMRAALTSSASTEEIAQKVAATESAVSQRVESGKGYELLKGRWVSKYVRYLVEERLRGEAISLDFSPELLVRVCLQSIKFQGDWTDYYRRQIEVLVPVA